MERYCVRICFVPLHDFCGANLFYERRVVQNLANCFIRVRFGLRNIVSAQRDFVYILFACFAFFLYAEEKIFYAMCHIYLLFGNGENSALFCSSR